MIRMTDATPTRADEIIPGEWIDLKTCSIGDFVEVTAVRYIEHTTTEDEVEIRYRGRNISTTRTYRASRMVDVRN